MKQWKVAGANHGFDGLSFEDATVPQVGENEVLVKLHAASLNYRDLVIPKDKYPFPLKFPVVGGSDGAGEVVKAGSKVSKWKPGDNFQPRPSVRITWHRCCSYGARRCYR
jgi:NADPH:quinone reductase-like Zn-dependent oxidoreductase